MMNKKRNYLYLCRKSWNKYRFIYTILSKMEKKYTNIKERVLYLAEYKMISKERFLESIGMTYGSFKGKAKNGTLNSDAIANISTNYNDVNLQWLLTGDGNMLKENEPYSLSPMLSSVKGVPYYDVDFIGGFDMILNEQTMLPSFYIDFSPFNDADYWVNITGKSMSPFISHGDIVALKRFDTWKEFILFGEIYAIITDDFRTVKIIGKSEDDTMLSLIPYSKSPEFSKQDIPKHLIRDIFKVKGSIKKFF